MHHSSVQPAWSEFPYPSHRTPLFARNAVATSHPLAAQAGLRMLLKGGNAADAALATAICLTVVEPTSNGIGSDAFALIWDGGSLHGLNASGKSPAGWSLERFRHLTEMPRFGWDSVTVPGAVSAWVAVHERFGRLPFADLFAPAIEYADRGFIVASRADWPHVMNYPNSPDLHKLFAPGGRAPQPGELFAPRGMASTLEDIATTRGESFYRGRLAGLIAKSSQDAGGCMTERDLAEHQPLWVEPIQVGYRDGLALHEIPPNGQGLAALIAVGILRRLQPASHPVDSADSVHLQIEAMKLGFVEARAHVADPEHMRIPIPALLDDALLDALAGRVRLDRAEKAQAPVPYDKGTVYLTAADSDGMMVSFIQSNYRGFGSGVVIPGTGISMQDRGNGFCLDPDHPNCVGPSKRPYHTIIPGFVTQNGLPLMSFGVMGGHHQPQGHLQVMVRMFDYNQNPQAALDAPRWHVDEDGRVRLEAGGPAGLADELRRRGHDVIANEPASTFGGGQIILKLADGYAAASEPRKAGYPVGF